MPCQGPYGGGFGGDSYRSDYLEAEQRLCEARWIILQLLSKSNSPKLEALVAKHRAEQLIHRRGDKRLVLDRIKATMNRIREDMADIVRSGGEVGDGLYEQERRLKEEQKRIRVITDEQLLADYWGTETRLTSDLVDHE